MIAYLKGLVTMIDSDSIVVECAQVGYSVNFASTQKVKLNEESQVFIYQHIREDENTLYGFLKREEKELFIKLISVKGLGPKTAMNMFNAMNYETILRAIEEGDVALIKSLPGIGAKTASQIVLDLKGKLVESSSKAVQQSQEAQDAIDALKALGYKASELVKISKKFSETPNKSTDEYIKMGLQALIKHGR